MFDLKVMFEKVKWKMVTLRLHWLKGWSIYENMKDKRLNSINFIFIQNFLVFSFKKWSLSWKQVSDIFTEVLSGIRLVDEERQLLIIWFSKIFKAKSSANLFSKIRLVKFNEKRGSFFRACGLCQKNLMSVWKL